jgi:hypothetical protein
MGFERLLKFVAFSLFMSTFSTSCSVSRSGPSGGGGDIAGNGGEATVLEFKAASRTALAIAHASPEISEKVDLKQLEASVNEAVVQSVDQKLFVQGVEKDAVNYPSTRKIFVNRARWRLLDDSTRLALVLHEHLGLLSINDRDYEISYLLLDVDPTTLRVRRNQVDILIVADNSGSMAAHQNNLARQVEHLWNRAEERRLNFQFAVISTSVGDRGRFYGGVVSSRTRDGLKKLRQNIYDLGTGGDSLERFFDSAVEALSTANLAGPNKGFLRPNANLEIVFLSDTDDQSRISSSQFEVSLRALKPAGSVFAYGILALPQDRSCLSEGDPSRWMIPNVSDFILRMGGDFRSICSIDPTMLSTMGTEIADRVDLRTRN